MVDGGPFVFVWAIDDDLHVVLKPLDGSQGDWIGIVSAKDEHVHRFVDGDVFGRNAYHRSICISVNDIQLTQIFCFCFFNLFERNWPTFHSEKLRRLNRFLLQVVGDRITGPAGDVASMVMSIESENQSTLGNKCPIRLNKDKSLLVVEVSLNKDSFREKFPNQTAQERQV